MREALKNNSSTPPRLREAAVLLLCLGSVGCFPGFTLEPGLWKLKIQGEKREQNVRVGEVLDPRAVVVEVVLNYNESEGESVETAEVYFIDFDPEQDAAERQNLPPLAGVISTSPRRPGIKRIRLDGRDRNWSFAMSAEIHARDFLEGVVWGRRLFPSEQVFEGKWVMEKLSSSEEANFQ